MEMKKERCPTLILGLGNPLRGDDGIGPAVVEALQKIALPPEVEVVDGGTAGLGLLQTIADRRRLLVVDAADMGLPPGTVRQVRPAACRPIEHTTLSPHELGFADLLALAERLGMAPEEVQILVVQPRRTGYGQDLSPTVRDRLPQIIETLMAQIECPQRQRT